MYPIVFPSYILSHILEQRENKVNSRRTFVKTYSELKILELLWDNGELTAKDIAAQASEQVGWSKITTYTVMKKCVEKGLVERREPGFCCRAMVTRD